MKNLWYIQPDFFLKAALSTLILSKDISDIYSYTLKYPHLLVCPTIEYKIFR